MNQEEKSYTYPQPLTYIRRLMPWVVLHRAALASFISAPTDGAERVTMRTFQYFACENTSAPDNDLVPGAGLPLTLQATEKQDNKQDINPIVCRYITYKTAC